MERTDLAGRALRLAVNTQTPLVRLRQESLMALPRVHLDDLLPEHDYKFTAGGVTRMLLPLLRRGLAEGRLADAEWVALGGSEHHPRIEMDPGLKLSFVGMPREIRRGYAKVKEHLWALLNSLPPPEGEVSNEAWRAFLRYQQDSAASLEAASRRMGGADLLYVHDFQQMGVARAWEGHDAPRLFHLHTPFPARLPGEWRDRVVDALNAYDAVVCSTERYANNLRAAGLDTPVHVVAPFIDPRDYHEPDEKALAQFQTSFGIDPDEPMILHVGRMDPMKGQDRLIRMLPHVLKDLPNARLVLVGNGSFSSSKNGGLGLSKGAKWRARLESLAAELDVTHRVTFTGHLDDAGIEAAYATSNLFVLPSTREGFGLAAVEAWRYRKPVIVSPSAGIADLVEDGSNGLVVDCNDAERLARESVRLLNQPERAQAMGDAGHETSRLATLPHGERALNKIFHELMTTEGRHAVR